MTTEAKPEFGEFIVEVEGKPIVTKHVQTCDGRTVYFIWVRGLHYYGITITDRLNAGGTATIHELFGSTDTVQLAPNEHRHWQNNDLLLAHTIS